MEDLKKLMERLRDEAHALGLEMSQCAFIPNPNDGPDLVQAAFLIRPEAIVEPEVVDPDQAKIDEEFQALMGGALKSAEDQQAEDEMKRIRDEAAKWFEGG